MKLLLRFLPGIIVLEVATAALLHVLTMPAAHPGLWAPVAVLGGVVTLLTAFWFGSIADHARKDALLGARASHAREREEIVVTAELEKRVALEQTHRRLAQATARAQAQANWRLGLGLTGLVAVGFVLLAIEFMTVGLLVMAAAGGALGGYLWRARQETRYLLRGEGGFPGLAGRSIKTIEPPSAAAPRTRR